MAFRRGACMDITCERPSVSQLARVSRSSSGVIHVARARGPHAAATAAAITMTCSGGIVELFGEVFTVGFDLHSGISPCFFSGRSSRLFFSTCSDIATKRRVSLGSMTSSTIRRPAAT